MFEKYSQLTRGRSSGIRLNGRGLMSLGAEFVRRYNIGGAAYMTLLYDPESKAIGLQLHASKVEGAAKISVQRQARCCCAKGFATKYAIPPGRFSAEWNRDLQLIVCVREIQQ